MNEQTLASEVIAEQQERLIAVICELDYMDVDFDKVLFIINELIDSVDLKEPKTMDDALLLWENQQRIDMLAGIVTDYIRKIQTTISDIVIRERKRNKKDGTEGSISEL